MADLGRQGALPSPKLLYSGNLSQKPCGGSQGAVLCSQGFWNEPKGKGGRRVGETFPNLPRVPRAFLTGDQADACGNPCALYGARPLVSRDQYCILRLAAPFQCFKLRTSTWTGTSYVMMPGLGPRKFSVQLPCPSLVGRWRSRVSKAQQCLLFCHALVLAARFSSSASKS